MREAKRPPEPPPKPRRRKGLIIVNTGEGKGKTTSALGVALRAAGQDLRVCIVQFIKGKWVPGEVKIAARLAPNYEIIPMGEGFTWLSKDLEKDKSKAQEGWKIAKEKIRSGNYHVVVLDEITYPINYGFIDLKDVLETLSSKPEMLHIIITGRDAPQELMDMADLVTEMKQVKHPYGEGMIAQKGIEF